MKFILRFFFYRLGWKISGQVDPAVRKGIFAVAPHWNNADFFTGLGSRAVLDRKIAFLGKAELFRPPFGFIFRALGGIPVYRSEKRNLVESQVDAVKGVENALIALAPEGTRKNVARLRSGFYYIAHGAGIPIIMVGFDRERKEVKIAEPFYTSGDFKEDMKTRFVPFFEQIGGRKKDWVENYKKGVFNH